MKPARTTDDTRSLRVNAVTPWSAINLIEACPNGPRHPAEHPALCGARRLTQLRPLVG